MEIGIHDMFFKKCVRPIFLSSNGCQENVIIAEKGEKKCDFR